MPRLHAIVGDAEIFSFSLNTYVLPPSFQSRDPVVPDPAKGSKTVCPGSVVARIKRVINPTGN